MTILGRARNEKNENQKKCQQIRFPLDYTAQRQNSDKSDPFRALLLGLILCDESIARIIKA
jgi:hypothetical protein